MTPIEETLKKYECIERVDNIIAKLEKIPDGKDGFWGIKYDERLSRSLNDEADAWEMEIRQILIAHYTDNSQQVNGFPSRIGNRQSYLDFRENLKSELKACKSYLLALIKSDNIKKQLSKSEDNETAYKAPMLFISHSSKDKEFVKALVSLLESLGFCETNLFCSSIPEYGIKLGQDIFEGLRKLFESHELFVIFIQSPRYFESPVSLNEMGAAWVLKTNCCSFLTKDMKIEDMNGVVGRNVLSIKVNAEEATARLNELKDLLTEIFGLNPLNETTWERKRNEFLKSVI